MAASIDPPFLKALLRELDGWIEDAGERIRALSGGATLCRLGRDGATPVDVKYEEGRMTGFRDARRLLASGGEPRQLHARLEDLARRWQEQHDRHRARFGASGGWVSYDEGGVDALAFVRARLDDRV